MSQMFSVQEEKKVEYLELIYDLIFVYLVGRNNSLIQTIENGFVPPAVFGTYLLYTVIVIQIWSMTMLFINRYGTNGLQEHIAIFINMYLLYFMAEGTQVRWQVHYVRYNAAWGLILLNLMIQHILKYRKADSAMPSVMLFMRRQIRNLGIMTGIVFASIPLWYLTGIPLSPVAAAVGFFLSSISGKADNMAYVDFRHLTERIMLYVVFTFGEMIIAISGYFKDDRLDASTLYFSLMAFLIVVGLFLAYGFVYDHIVDREMTPDSTGYMMLHIFMILAMNFITTGLEFMREPKVAAVPKNIFLTVSFLLYYVFLSQTARFAKNPPEAMRRLMLQLLAICAGFAVLMMLCYRNARVSIAVSVLFIYTVFFHLWFSWKHGVKGV